MICVVDFFGVNVAFLEEFAKYVLRRGFLGTFYKHMVPLHTHSKTTRARRIKRRIEKEANHFLTRRECH